MRETTVTAAVAVFPLLVAVIVAFPGAIPVTTPAGDTVAMASLLEVHEIVAPETVLPLPSFAVAVKFVVAPTRTLGLAGLTVTLTTAAVPVRGVLSLPHAVATMIAAMIDSVIPRFRMVFLGQ
jgi:hypothetical protein